MKIPFNIKYRDKIESGEYKVKIRDGRPARIICWEANGCQPIIVLIRSAVNAEEEIVLQLYADGRFSSDERETMYDLFIVTPEPELTEWQRFISACLQKHGLLDCGAADRIAKESAAELLELARKETEIDGTWYLDAYKKGWDDAIDDYNEALRIKYEQGKAEVLKDLQENLANNDIYSVPEWLREVLLMAKENGKKEALKDLPRWVFYRRGTEIDPLAVVRFKDGTIGRAKFATDDCYVLEVKDMLKLPGFKKDKSHE